MHGLKSRDIAISLGQKMADAITARNPAPVKMKFEYVYHPCILQTKKRYVGLQFERKGEPPTLDAKGIESIRVDQCPLTQKLMDRSLRLLFEPPYDISRVKHYVQHHWLKIEQGRIPVDEFVSAKVLLSPTKKDLPPATVVAQRIVSEDRVQHHSTRNACHLSAQPHAAKNASIETLI